ncbi:ArsR family transcriptional regulator [Peptoniphilus olsenii]|uniref:ArsR family transcriptional regulator n=1 Tax=Peptoniphilus olsenii TaxID=411570 RepID=A0ABV2JC39_9FIRM
MNEIDVALICKNLADSNRLKILKMISKKEKCACELLDNMDISQPTLSYHMKLLNECGIVKTRKEGKWSYYSIDRKNSVNFLDFINSIINE